ncbi:hypothetical protein ACK3SF_04965 [Candidatus Nanosalina sp. VS9-1]|uniref:hypothetical protein n=1 Tax=Candidatus Nanosalina sp. VS9-1 TaxID=3388566 RepID=UPI0039DFEF93
MKIASMREIISKLGQKRVLGLELFLALFCIAVYVYLATGDASLEFFILPVSAILLVPLFSTLAYYRDFRRTGLAAVLSIVALPVIIIGGMALLYLPSRAGGLAILLALIYSAIAAAVVPYAIFAVSLATHYYRKTFTSGN